MIVQPDYDDFIYKTKSGRQFTFSSKGLFEKYGVQSWWRCETPKGNATGLERFDCFLKKT
jgi:hypothetical protein